MTVQLRVGDRVGSRGAGSSSHTEAGPAAEPVTATTRPPNAQAPGSSSTEADPVGDCLTGGHSLSASKRQKSLLPPPGVQNVTAEPSGPEVEYRWLGGWPRASKRRRSWSSPRIRTASTPWLAGVAGS